MKLLKKDSEVATPLCARNLFIVLRAIVIGAAGFDASSWLRVCVSSPRGGGTLSNGELLNVAEEAGFDLLLTTDRRETDRRPHSIRLLLWGPDDDAAIAPAFAGLGV